jgi:hypothetical protein
LCLNTSNLENFVEQMKSTVESLGKNLCSWANSHLKVLKEASDRDMLNDNQFLEMWNIKEENEVAFCKNLTLLKKKSNDLRRSQSSTEAIFNNFDLA